MENMIESRKVGFYLTWNQLKWIAVVSMLIDHISKVLFSQIFYIEYLGMDIETSYMICNFLPAVGRIAFPIFAFGIAQGCRLTHSPTRYLLRLALFAVASEIPYNLAMRDMAFSFPLFTFHNVFFTLLIGALCCRFYAFFRSIGMAWASFVFIFCLAAAAEFIGTEYGGLGVLFVLLPYLSYSNKRIRIVLLGAAVVIFYVFYAQFSGFGACPFVWMDPRSLSIYCFTDVIGALVGVALLAFYNGQRGKGYHKWLFYTIYPAHLLLLYLLKLAAFWLPT